MKFVEPAVLAYMFGLLIALIIFYIWAQEAYRRASSRFAQRSLLNKLAPPNTLRIRRVRTLLMILAVLLIGMALARPQWGLYWKGKKAKGFDVWIALDVSKSMLTQDIKPSRLLAAKAEIKDFIKNLHGDRVGLIAFSGDAFLFCPLTLDYDGFALALDNVTTASISKGGTSLAAAIEEALRNIKWADVGERILIIISDGENNEGDLDKALEAAKKEGLKIFCVGIGTREGSLISYTDEKGALVTVKDQDGKPVRARLDEKTLQNMASQTGGLYVHATQAAFGLEVIYDKGFAKLKKRAREETLSQSYQEQFQVPLAIAFVLLVLEMVLGLAGKREELRGRPAAGTTAGPGAGAVTRRFGIDAARGR